MSMDCGRKLLEPEYLLDVSDSDFIGTGLAMSSEINPSQGQEPSTSAGAAAEPITKMKIMGFEVELPPGFKLYPSQITIIDRMLRQLCNSSMAEPGSALFESATGSGLFSLALGVSEAQHLRQDNSIISGNMRVPRAAQNPHARRMSTPFQGRTSHRGRSKRPPAVHMQVGFTQPKRIETRLF